MHVTEIKANIVLDEV